MCEKLYQLKKEVTELDKRIKEIRESAGLTQVEFGKKIGLARNTIANYETGNRIPSNIVINSICREFGISEEPTRKNAETVIDY